MPECDYQAVGAVLTSQVYRDFTFIHPDFLEQKCRQEGATLHLDNKLIPQDYRVIILPGGRVIPWASLRKIKAFRDAGGKVVATTCLPSQSAEPGHDAEVQATIKEMFGPLPEPSESVAGRTNASWSITAFTTQAGPNGGGAWFARTPTAGTLKAILDQALPVPDVGIEGDLQHITSGIGRLSYLHKVKDGNDLYFFANSSDDHIDAWVRLKGRFNVQVWDPHTGAMADAEQSVIDVGGCPLTLVYLVLDQVRSLFLMGSGK